MKRSIAVTFLAFAAAQDALCPTGWTQTESSIKTASVYGDNSKHLKTVTCHRPTACMPGYADNSDASEISCYSRMSCNAKCCKLIKTSCAAMDINLSCPDSEYKDPSKDGVDFGVMPTEDEQLNNCCTAKATCSNYTCPDGYAATPDSADTTCPSDVASCANFCKTRACTLVETSCLALPDPTYDFCTTAGDKYKKTDAYAAEQHAEPVDYYKDPSKSGVTAGTTEDEQFKNCCTGAPATITCGAFKCADVEDGVTNKESERDTEVDNTFGYPVQWRGNTPLNMLGSLDFACCDFPDTSARCKDKPFTEELVLDEYIDSGTALSPALSVLLVVTAGILGQLL